MATPIAQSRSSTRLFAIFRVDPKTPQLRPREDGNFELPDFAGLIVKRNYWCWFDTRKGGNAIDFFVQVLGRTFHQAMTVIMEQIERDKA